MTHWYSRPIVPVSDVAEALRYYIDTLGFAEDWRHDAAGRLLIAQIGRVGCEFILSCQWPAKVGQAMQFISLEPEVLDALRTDLESRGIETKDGWWGYKLMILRDPDGNELFFPYEAGKTE